MVLAIFDTGYPSLMLAHVTGYGQAVAAQVKTPTALMVLIIGFQPQNNWHKPHRAFDLLAPYLKLAGHPKGVRNYPESSALQRKFAFDPVLSGWVLTGSVCYWCPCEIINHSIGHWLEDQVS